MAIRSTSPEETGSPGCGVSAPPGTTAIATAAAAIATTPDTHAHRRRGRRARYVRIGAGSPGAGGSCSATGSGAIGGSSFSPDHSRPSRRTVGAAAPRATERSSSVTERPSAAAERGAPEVPRRRVAILRRLGQRPRQHAIEPGRHAVGQRRARRLVVQVGEHRRRHGLAQERRRARERGEQHAAERVDVGARVVGAGMELLGRHVVDRAEEVARRWSACRRRRSGSARSRRGRRGRR